MGAVIMLPMPIKHFEGVTITVMPLVLHYINEIRLYSSLFKLQQVRPDFGKLLMKTLIVDPSDHAVLAGQPVHWRVIQRHFGKQNPKNHPEIFEPHIQPEDLYWRKAEEVLYRLEPALHFWYDMDYAAALYRGHPVSFNLMDVAVSYVNRFEFSNRCVNHFRQSLWNEILTRYLGQKNLEVQILKQLDTETVESDLFALSPQRLR
jgi:hypothetical protein